MPSIIQLDDNGLQTFVQESIRQILSANRGVETELGVTIQPRFKIAFSGLVVAQRGLNAIERATTSSTEPQVGESIDEATFEKTTHDGEQNGKTTELSKVTSLESQTGGNLESTTSHGSNSQRDTGLTRTDGTETGSTGGETSSMQKTTSRDTTHSEQSQVNGTTSVTTTEYTR